MFSWNSLAFSMIQQMLAMWTLVLLPFLKPAWTSGSSQFTCCWSLAWRILSVSLLACEMSAIVQYFVLLIPPITSLTGKDGEKSVAAHSPPGSPKSIWRKGDWRGLSVCLSLTWWAREEISELIDSGVGSLLSLFCAPGVGWAPTAPQFCRATKSTCCCCVNLCKSLDFYELASSLSPRENSTNSQGCWED